MAALDRVMSENRAQVAAVRVDWSAIRKAAGRTAPMLEFILPPDAEETEADDGGVGIGEAIAGAPEEERNGLLVAYLRTQIAKVLGTAPDRLDDDQPLNEVGLDSLMGVELKNRVESDLRIALPVATLLQAPSVSQFAEKIRAQLFGQSQPALDRIEKEETPEEMLANVDGLSDDEVETLLANLAQESTTNE